MNGSDPPLVDTVPSLRREKAALQTEIDRLRALSDKLWTEHLIGREELKAEIERLRAVLQECGADYESPPGTVMSTAGHVAREFMRRMEVARRALEPKP